MGMRLFFLILVLLLVAGVSGAAAFFLQGRKKKSLLALLVTIGVAITWYCIPMNDRLANAMVFPDDTVYAKGYSESSFQEIRSGDKVSTVLVTLGTPFSQTTTLEDGKVYWSYTRPGLNSDSYWIRIVIIDREAGCVVGKVSEFYAD